jgi:hypothetical protein
MSNNEKPIEQTKPTENASSDNQFLDPKTLENLAAFFSGEIPGSKEESKSSSSQSSEDE